MGWVVTIGQGGSIRTQDRVVDIRVTEEFAHKEFVVTVQKPTQAERDQAKGRINNAIIQIKRGSDIYIEGFIEDVELGQDIVKYSGRTFLVLLGYTTSSKTSGAGAYEAEYNDKDGAYIIDDLLDKFCYPHDNELTYTDLTFTETYGGEVKLHGKKVYDIVRNMCIDHSKDLWADATWNGDGVNVDNKNIYVGTKSRGNAGAPQKTLYGGQHLKNIPTVKYRSSQNVINRIRVNGKGSGKEKISVVVNDATSQTTYGVIEGSPYNNNMIVDETTAEAVGQAIIDAKKDLVEEVHLDLIIYISDLKYGDWVRILDSYSGVDTTQRIKKITRAYNSQQGESVSIEIGMPFDNYEMIIKDLTKGDVDEEPEMSKQGGALRLTANDPPGNWIRHDPGQWYDTIGTFQEKSKGAVPFWTGADNPATGTYKKALIQISNAGSVTYKVGTQETTAGAAEGTTVSADALNTPLGEVILKGKSGSVGNYVVEDVYSSDDAGKSYIYRDVRPIVGSSSTGFGGDVSNPLTENLAAGGFKITGLGAANADGDAISLDGDGYVPIAKLPLGGTGLKGGLLVGTETVCSSILPGANTYVLTADDTEALGIKWSAAGASSLWEDMGSYVRLIVADDVDFRAKNILHLASLRSNFAAGMTIFDSNGATKAYLGPTGYAFKANADIDMATSWKLKNLAAGAVAGDSIRYDEYSVHTHDGRYYTETEINTWRNSTTQTEMGYLHGITSDIQMQLNARMLLSVYDPGSDGVVIPTAGGTGQSSYAKGDILYASNTNVLSKLAHGTENQVLTMNATLIPVWSSAGAAGLWEVSGIYAQLIVAKAIDMQTNDIVKCSKISGQTTGVAGADKLIIDFRGDSEHLIKYTGTSDNRLGYFTSAKHAFLVGYPSASTIAEIDANGLVMNTGKTIKAYSGDLTIGSNMSLGGSYKIKSLAAGAVNGDSVRYNEFHAHDIATTGVHGVGGNTIEHTGHKGAASGYCDLDADTRVPNNRYMLTTKGYLLVGKDPTTCDTIAPGTNTHVLTLDSTEALGMKWAAPSGGGLWQDMGTYVQLIQADSVSLRSQYITNLHDPQYSTDAATKNYVDIHNWAAGDITSGILAVARGGTGVSGDTYDADKVDGCHAGITNGDVFKITTTGVGYVFYTGAGGSIYGLSPGTSGYQLTTRGSGMTPHWAAPSAGMWEVSGAYARLIAAKPIDLREQNLDNVGERIQFDTSQTYSKIQFHGTADALHYTHTEAPDPVVDRWDFFINNVSRLQVAVDAIDAWVPLDMNSQKISGLPEGTVNGDSIRYDEYSVHTHDGRYYTETEIDTWRNSTTQTEMGYLNEVSSNIQDQLNARLPLTAGSGNPLSGDLYMGNNDIIDCKDIKGDTSGTDGADRLNLDFRGDANHRIYYTGTADNRLGYKTYNAHAFSIQSTVIAQIDANGLHMQTGKYIKSSGGDLELRAPSGQRIKFVIG